MERIIGWAIFAVILWAIVTVATFVAPHFFPSFAEAGNNIQDAWLQSTSRIGGFFAPVVQFAIVLFIVIEGAKRLGFEGFFGNKNEYEKTNPVNGSDNVKRDPAFPLSTERVQAVLALSIVISLCIAAFTGLPGVGVLKDLALVVVGFYFGSRIKKDEEIAWLRNTSASRADGTQAETPNKEDS